MWTTRLRANVWREREREIYGKRSLQRGREGPADSVRADIRRLASFATIHRNHMLSSPTRIATISDKAERARCFLN